MSFRVVHINVAKAFRGGERQTELLIRQLHARGTTQTLIGRRFAPLAERLGDLVPDLDIRMVTGDVLETFGATAGADIVHVHEGRSVYAAYLRALVSKTPYILTRRVNNPIGDHFFAHRAYRRASFVAAVAPQVADVVRAYDSRVRVKVVQSSSSGLSADDASVRRIKSTFPGNFVVGHVGALDNDQKGQEFIIELARRYSETDPNVSFVMVGGGADEAMLKDMAAGLSHVVFTGFVDNVGDSLAAFDVFILPSRREGIGSILLDAMDFGLPIVATAVGGVPSIVIDDENGILVDSEDVNEMEAALRRLQLSAELRRRLGERGRQIGSQYTPTRMCEKYLELYGEALGFGR